MSRYIQPAAPVYQVQPTWLVCGERHGVILLSKTALIDGVWATVGSTNLDWRSFLHNHELNAVVRGPDFVKQVQAMFD